MASSPEQGARSSLLQEQPELTRKPSLLPAFEPLSSSPFPRPTSSKRKFQQDSPSLPKQQLKYYPTPVPTSSTGILPSSSPRNVRPGLQRVISTLSERVPLGDVPSVDLPADGEIVRMGRSSNSSDFQLSANRLISRVHVQAAYHAPTASSPSGHVEVECLGWNGAKIHCRGHVFELQKGESYVSENPEADIMLDVQDTRVMIMWPPIASGSKLLWGSEDDMSSPTRRPALDQLASSPPIVPRSPVSQSPIRQPNFGPPLTSQSPAPVKVFEDADDDDDDEGAREKTPVPEDHTFIRPAVSHSSPAPKGGLFESKASMLSSFAADDFSDGDEENDPVVHSFGPFGENILPRLASFSTDTPTQPTRPIQRHRQPLRSSQSPRSRPANLLFKNSPIKNHVINQLAYSRNASILLSSIHGNLPAELRACVAKVPEDSKGPEASGSRASTPDVQLSQQDLKKLMDDIPCIGAIHRLGKDAAGKPLEDEFYYVPEMDSDPLRREAVTGSMRGGGLRSTRKQHKQYYWKRPKV